MFLLQASGKKKSKKGLKKNRPSGTQPEKNTTGRAADLKNLKNPKGESLWEEGRPWAAGGDDITAKVEPEVIPIGEDDQAKGGKGSRREVDAARNKRELSEEGEGGKKKGRKILREREGDQEMKFRLNKKRKLPPEEWIN